MRGGHRCFGSHAVVPRSLKPAAKDSHRVNSIIVGQACAGETEYCRGRSGRHLQLACACDGWSFASRGDNSSRTRTPSPSGLAAGKNFPTPESNSQPTTPGRKWQPRLHVEDISMGKRDLGGWGNGLRYSLLRPLLACHPRHFRVPAVRGWRMPFTLAVMSKLAPRVRLLVPLAGLALVALVALWLVDARVGRLWINTAWLVAGACLAALPLGTLAAVAIFKTDVPGRWLAAVLLTAMLFIPLFLVTGAWDAGFGIQGWHTIANNPHLAHEPWLAGWRAAIWIHGLAAVPWVVLIVGAGLRSVEAELEEDAALCASPAKVVWHVTLPRSLVAIIVAALWVAIVASAEISVTDFFQVRTFAEEVYTQSALGAFDFVNPTTGTDAADANLGRADYGSACCCRPY